MHGSVLLPTSVRASLLARPSRIPHLAAHINRRQREPRIRPRRPWPLTVQLRRQCWQHASPISILARQYSSTVRHRQDAPSGPQDADERRTADAQRTSPDDGDAFADASPFYARREPVTMQQLLDENHPDRILQGLTTTAMGDPFVQNASDDDFAQAICALDPDHFIVPYRTLHRYLKPSIETEPRFRTVKSLEERMAVFTGILDALIAYRQESGHAITLDVCRHLLRCAAACGNGNMARVVFRELMPENDLVPDLDCYNYFMEALGWNQAYGRFERYNLRVTPHSLRWRSQDFRRAGFRGHSVSSPSNPHNEQSIRFECLRIFNELVRQQLKGDEATFCNLMIAMGREGDLAGVNSVLKSVWNIDVDALNSYDEEELESPAFYDDGSPLKPSERLLSTVVHIFSTNNEAMVASMLLDYIARHYNLTVPPRVWTHLLEWTFVLAVQDEPWRIRRGYNIGNVSHSAVESLYEAFHGEPFHVAPSVVDLNFRLKSRIRRHLLDRTLDDVRESIRLLDDDRTTVSRLYDDMMKLVQGDYHAIFHDGVASAKFLDLKRDFVLASLHLECHLQLIIVAVRNTLKEKEWAGAGKLLEWPSRRLPLLVHEFAEFLPDIVPYYTPTGHVRLAGHEHRARAIFVANGAQTTRTGSMRTMFDSFSPARLRHAAFYVRRGPRGLAAFDEEAAATPDLFPTDWVLDLERQGRATRLQSERFTALTPPGPETVTGEWRPWSNTFSTWSS